MLLDRGTVIIISNKNMVDDDFDLDEAKSLVVTYSTAKNVVVNRIRLILEIASTISSKCFYF